ncbi:MAG: hypothetical protein AB1631_30060 [Acidobacteriota bacterium]
MIPHVCAYDPDIVIVRFCLVKEKIFGFPPIILIAERRRGQQDQRSRQLVMLQQIRRSINEIKTAVRELVPFHIQGQALGMHFKSEAPLHFFCQHQDIFSFGPVQFPQLSDCDFDSLTRLNHRVRPKSSFHALSRSSQTLLL